jgi:hypothetical protein
MLQTILVPKSKFSCVGAHNWAYQHGFKHDKIDDEGNFYRFRQMSPLPNVSYYTQTLPNGVELVYAKKK